jgi:hypothetical protein
MTVFLTLPEVSVCCDLSCLQVGQCCGCEVVVEIIHTFHHLDAMPCSLVANYQNLTTAQPTAGVMSLQQHLV